MWSNHFLFMLLLAAPTVNSFSHLTKEQRQDRRYRYFMCLARCGQDFGSRRNMTLASGEPVSDWQLDENMFGTCKVGCYYGTGFDPASIEPTESNVTPEFSKVDVICVDRLSVTPPRIRVKLSVPHIVDHKGNLTMYVVEVFRTLLAKDGRVDNEFVQRNFFFSPRFTIQHTFAGLNPKKEALTFRVFNFNPHAEVGYPSCSDSLLLDNVYAAHREPIALKMREKVQTHEGYLVLLGWQAPDTMFPPECEQFFHWTNGQKPNHKLVNLDSSHTVVISYLNDTSRYVITAYGRSDAGQDQRITSKFILCMNPEPHELIHEELAEFMDGFAIAAAVSVVFMLLVCFSVYFCVEYVATIRRRELSKSNCHISKRAMTIGSPIKTSTPCRDETCGTYSFAVKSIPKYPTSCNSTDIYTRQHFSSKKHATPHSSTILSFNVQGIEQKDTLC